LKSINSRLKEEAILDKIEVIDVILFFILIIFTILMATIFARLLYDNTNKYETLTGIYANIITTIVLAAITVVSVRKTQDVINQSKKEQRITYIGESMKNFYEPLRILLYNQNNKFSYGSLYNLHQEKILEIGRYLYLAEPEARNSYLTCRASMNYDELNKNVRELVDQIHKDLGKQQKELDKLTKYK
jgi:hypothetical protein